ncbi:MAG: hypothetical protein PHT16_03955 [Candidatus Pacebacteria bacterium]|nr:hypothetical protein [Candidatus Paceibacterota bacterium]
MRMDKEPIPGGKLEKKLDSRTEVEVEEAFRKKILAQKLAGTFFYNKLTEAEQAMFDRITKEEKEDANPRYGH